MVKWNQPNNSSEQRVKTSAGKQQGQGEGGNRDDDKEDDKTPARTKAVAAFLKMGNRATVGADSDIITDGRTTIEAADISHIITRLFAGRSPVYALVIPSICNFWYKDPKAGDQSMHDLLKSTYLFARLDEQQLTRVTQIARKRPLEDGETLFEAGDPATHFYLVVSGHIKLTRLAPNGNEKVIEIISSGHTFAEALMFADAPTYPVSATAIERSELIAFENKAFVALLRESIDTCFRMMSDMSQRLRRMIKEIDDLTLQTAMGRVAGFLCAKHSLEKHGSDEFDLETPKGIIASRLSVKPETFSRILGTFSSQGLLSVKGSRVAILDADGLRAVAQSSGICGILPIEKKL